MKNFHLFCGFLKRSTHLVFNSSSRLRPCDPILVMAPEFVHAPHRRWLTLIVRWLISSGYLFAKVSLYFSLYFMTGQFRIVAAVLLTNPEDLNKFIHNPLLVLPLHESPITMFHLSGTHVPVTTSSSLSAS